MAEPEKAAARHVPEARWAAAGDLPRGGTAQGSSTPCPQNTSLPRWVQCCAVLHYQGTVGPVPGLMQKPGQAWVNVCGPALRLQAPRAS